MSTPLIIDEVGRKRIRELCAAAQAKPVDMLKLVSRINTADGKEQHVAQMTAQTIDIPLAFRVTFSVENGHPCGTCYHMSVSVQRKGRIPNEHAVWLIAQEFGFKDSLQKCTVWPETLRGHGIAINVVQPVDLDSAGAGSRWYRFSERLPALGDRIAIAFENGKEFTGNPYGTVTKITNVADLDGESCVVSGDGFGTRAAWSLCSDRFVNSVVRSDYQWRYSG
jgi:hypothetical protein